MLEFTESMFIVLEARGACLYLAGVRQVRDAKRASQCWRMMFRIEYKLPSW